jgi:hypothetical protein
MKTWHSVALLLVVGLPLRGDEAEDRAVKALQKLGARIERDEKADGKPVISVNLGLTKVTDAHLKELAPLKHLQTLYLYATRVTDEGLKELAPLQNLQWLHLAFTQVTDAGLKDLAALKSLRSLDLQGTQVTDAGLKQLRLALPDCKIGH